MAVLALIYGLVTFFTGGRGIYPEGSEADVLKGNIGPLPKSLAAFLLTVIVGQFILSCTRFGRHIHMVGSNIRAAEAAGIETWHTVTGAYVVAGLCTACSAVLMAARYASGDMEHGIGYDYQAISAVLVGGTAIGGGEGSALRTLAGAVHHRAGAGAPPAQRLQHANAISHHRRHRADRDHVADAGRAELSMLGRFVTPSLRPYLLLAAIVIVLAVVDAGQGRFINRATAFSVLQQFATIGPVALALGLSMIVREFDLSVGGMLSLAGCLAVMSGGNEPALGIALAVLAGAAAGLLQGGIMVGLGLSSVGVTLGGLLTLGGLTYVLTENTTISYPRMDVALLVNDPVLGVLSLRSIVAIAAFIVAGFVMARTRIGRDVVATGSDRRAALIAGVRVDRILIGVFAVSGVLTALAGSLLSYSLAAASPVALADTLIPAAAAAIIGGVSLAGGKGTPAGIAGGVLVLAVLRSGLTAIGVPPFMHDVVTGGVLLAVALLDAGDLERRLFGLRRALGRKV